MCFVVCLFPPSYFPELVHIFLVLILFFPATLQAKKGSITFLKGVISVPQLGFELSAPALETWSLNHWTTREIS